MNPQVAKERGKVIESILIEVLCNLNTPMTQTDIVTAINDQTPETPTSSAVVSRHLDALLANGRLAELGIKFKKVGLAKTYYK